MFCKNFVRKAFSLLLYSFTVPVSSAPAKKGVDGVAIVERDAAKYVFAHFMVGIVQNYQISDWKNDMSYAQEIGIDAFALNCASVDSYTPTQLANAYQAASEVGFKVFISFDFAYWNNGDTANITQYMQTYSGHPAQMQYNGGAVVSTFVGDSFNWAPVKAGTSHSIFAIPNLQDPIEATYENTAFDGAFSWLAWPTDGGNSIIPGPMTTIWDDRFVTDLAGKPYMAPVSPWFSTHFNSKNWVFICESLITDRWIEMLDLKPQLVEIITWNDYGESHYIGPSEPNHTDDGSSQWAAGFPHDGWRIIMKAYIAAYKAGANAPTITQDQLVYWYRTTPKAIQCPSDPLGPPNGINLLADVIFVTTLLTSPATLTVTSGGNAPVKVTVPAGILTTNFTMGLGTQYFSLSRNGVPILSGQGGKQIVNTCVYYNFNAYVGSINGTGTINPPPPPTSTSQSTVMSSTSSTSMQPASSSSSSTSTSMSSSMMSSTMMSSTKTSTTRTKTSSTISNASSNPSPVCIAGTGPGNYVGLCQFCCSYGYCPPGPCTCTAYGTPVPTPPTTGTKGCPLYNEDNSYLGLCSFSCNHGYCPPTACRTC